MAVPNKETQLEWYRQMVLIREFEQACHDLYSEKRITGVYLHLYSGHEAIGVASVAAMKKPQDSIITAYRDHGLAIALGVELGPLMAEMMGRRAGTSHGKGGSMHIASVEHRFYGGYAIVGGQIPLATGLAFESYYNNTGGANICFIGDGASNNGYFHESLNISGAWKLPNVWVIENNLYGMGTEIARSAGNPILHERAIGYGVRDMGRIDGQDVFAMYDALTDAFEYARTGKGPVLIEAMTYRYFGHGMSDKQYSSRSDELKQWVEEKDPITLLRKRITKQFKNTEQVLAKFEADAKVQVKACVEFAEASPLPDTIEELMANVYTETAQD
jgi:pyruvate dehydrogenase E1 component alpha subunit